MVKAGERHCSISQLVCGSCIRLYSCSLTRLEFANYIVATWLKFHNRLFLINTAYSIGGWSSPRIQYMGSYFLCLSVYHGTNTNYERIQTIMLYYLFLPFLSNLLLQSVLGYNPVPPAPGPPFSPMLYCTMLV